jgi:hypothetical protein
MNARNVFPITHASALVSRISFNTPSSQAKVPGKSPVMREEASFDTLRMQRSLSF